MKFHHYPKEDRHGNLCNTGRFYRGAIEYTLFNLEQSNAKMPIAGTLRAAVPPFRRPRFRYKRYNDKLGVIPTGQ